jgi:hypothetical protein
MPDPVLFAKAFAAAAVVGVVVTLAAAVAFAKLQRLMWKQSAATATPLGVAVVLGIAVGGAVGFHLLGDLPPRSLEGDFPHWSVSRVHDRFLVVILPLAAFVDLIGAITNVPRWLVWILRLGLAAATGRILLHGSSYLQGTASNWSVSQVWTALGVGALLLAVVWILLARLLRRRPGISVPLALSQTCLAAGMTVMLSGYTDGGALGLPLAAAVAAAVIAARLLEKMPATEGAVGFGLVGLFGILMMGRFFGDLSTGRALALFVAPLLCWVSELPPLRARKAWVVGIVRLALVAIPLAIVLGLAKHEFDRDMAEPYAAVLSGLDASETKQASRKDAKTQSKNESHELRSGLLHQPT